MRVSVLRSVALGALLGVTIAACGGGDICLNCPPATPTPVSSVTVTGNVQRFTTFVNPQVTPVTVIVCLGLGSGQPASDCPQIFLAPLDPDTLTFTRSNVDGGSETIFFWIDQNGDGTIDPSDPIAQLQDPDDLLSEVEVGMTVTIGNAVVDFTNQTATASISVGTTPTPTPTPTGSPTPTPTATSILR